MQFIRRTELTFGNHPQRAVLWLVLLLFGLGCTGGRAPRSSTPGGPLDRGQVFVNITETLDGEPTEVNMVQQLLCRRLLYHGFRLVDEREKARFRIEGWLQCRHYRDTSFDYEEHSTHLEHQFQAELDCTLEDTSSTPDTDPELRTERIVFPEPLIYGRRSLAAAKRDIRRYAESILSPQLLNGRILGNPRVTDLINSLGNPYETRTFNEVVADLVTIGPAAVPYLLDGLTDSRPVRLEGQYPGLEKWNRDSFRYYHVFDQALGEILNRYSSLTLESSEEHLLRVQRGWAWAWEDLQEVPDAYRAFAEDRRETVPATPPGATPASPGAADSQR